MSPKKPLPAWAYPVLLVSGVGVGYVGPRIVTSDSPVHFGVVGEPPKDADGWDCKPEGGLYGAPLVCRYRQLDVDSTETETETK